MKSTPIRRVYVDMDDTLNSFTLFALQQLGCCITAFSYDDFPDVGYRIYDAYQVLPKLPCCGVYETEESFWEGVQWCQCSLRAPVCSEAQHILDFAASLVGKRNVYICTKPFSPGSAADKITWIERHFPDYADNYVLCQDKSIVGYPDTLLIDDSDNNIEEFRSGGGHAILVPRPWNSMRGYPTYPYLLQQFALHLTYKDRHAQTC